MLNMMYVHDMPHVSLFTNCALESLQEWQLPNTCTLENISFPYAVGPGEVNIPPKHWSACVATQLVI